MSAILHGDASGNQLNASANKTQVYGLKGNDTLTSNGKSDVLLIGGAGNDSLIMNGGNGTLSGGAGSDTFELNYSAAKKISAVIEDLDPANDKIIVNFDGSNAPQLTSSISGNDVVWSDADGNFNVTLKSIRENDYFDGDASEQAWQVLKLTNDEREKNNLSWLTMADGLMTGASIRVQEITELGNKNEFTRHQRLDESSWKTVFGEIGKEYANYGENLDGGATSAEQVLQDWMNSQTHKENILDLKVDTSGNPIKYKKLGVGYNYNDTDSSHQRYYWVQLFADSLNGAETVSANELSAVNLNVNAVSKFIELDDEPNTLDNAINGATIAALGGDDAIRNSGVNVSISGGNDSDTLINGGGFVTLNGGRGNDSINLNASAQSNLIQYASGDGSDTISGFKASDTLAITGREEFTPVTIGNDVVVSVGNDSIILQGAASLNNPNIDGRRSKLYILTDNPDTLDNTVNGATINALGGDDTITISGANVLFNYAAGDGSDIIRGFNTTSTLSITSGEYTPVTIGNDVVVAVGNDSITLTGAASLKNPNISGTRSKLYIGTRYSDTIETGIDGATIRALAGNDRINLTRGARNVLIEYAAGDNDDFVSGFSASDTLSITGVEYKRATVGNDLVLSVGDDSITLQGAATLANVNIIGTEIRDTSGGDTPTTPAASKFITLAGGGSYYYNTIAGATIFGGTGNDSIYNDSIAPNVSINGAAGDDTINNHGTNVTILGAAGTDTILNYSSNVTINGDDGNDDIVNYENSDSVTIDGGDGDDDIGNYSSQVTISAGVGNDSIWNFDDSDSVTIDAGDGNDVIANDGSQVTIDGGDGNDYIENGGANVTIDAGSGNDSIWNYGESVTIDSGEGNDRIESWSDNVTINAGDGDDSIENWGDNVTINAGDGDDSIENWGYSATIDGGAGDDTITLLSDAENNLIIYKEGEGNDSIRGLDANDTLKIYGTYSAATVGSDVILTVGEGSVTLAGAATVTPLNIENDANYIALTEGDDSYTNFTANVTIAALGGDDSINNSGANASISGAAGNDSIYNSGLTSTIDGGAGNDSVVNAGANVSIAGGDGSDTLNNYSTNVTINGGASNDYIYFNGPDTGTLVNSSVIGGAGDDTILNDSAYNVTVIGGAGNDSISLTDSAYNNLIQYAAGDGNDTVSGFGADDTLSITGGEYSLSTVGSDVVVVVGDGSITLEGAATVSPLNVVGTEASKLIMLTEGDDTYNNTVEGATIRALGGNDSILNDATNVSINGGNDDDRLTNGTSMSGGGSGVTLDGGAGNDSITNYGSNATIDGGVGNDDIVNWGDRVTIDGGAGNDSLIMNGGNGTLAGGAGNDTIYNNGGDSVTIDGGEGNDTIYNGGDSVTISGGAGNDYAYNLSNNVTILGGAGNDSISNAGFNVSIDGGTGRDTVRNNDDRVTIDAGDGDDSIDNRGSNASISAGDGNDTIVNRGASVKIDGGEGDDTIDSYGDSVTIDAGAGNDSIHGSNARQVIINGGGGADNIFVNGVNNFINGGADSDKITVTGTANQISGDDGTDQIYLQNAIVSTVSGGKGDDQITLSSNARNNIIRHAASDGNDTVWGYSGNTTLNVLGVSTFSSVVSGDDVIIRVGNGSVRLVDARNKPIHIIIGESGSSGGTGGNDGGGGSGGNDGGGRGGNDGGRGTGGGSGNEGRGSDASGGNSASGSRGNTGNTSGGTYGSNRRNPFLVRNERQNNPTPTISAAPRQIIYTGGNQVVGNYTNEKIIFGTTYTGSFVDGGTFYFGSETGALALENSANKLIDIRDAWDNPFIKGYLASTAGVIDGRNLSGFEVINGSSGADEIFVGNDGSQMWGGAGNVSDNLTGGNGVDIFIGGKDQGADNFFNAASNDIVHFNDAALSDIAYTSEDNGTIAVNFNNGNVVNVQSSESTSARFLLADGSEYRYDHANKSWQTNQRVYGGGNQVVSNYSGEPIIFGGEFAGAFVDGNNFNFLSTTGALTIQNAADKLIDLRDGNGNEFIKGYAASTAGTIDGRNLSGFEVINGSAGSDEIFAGNGGSQLWGGVGNVSDVLTGGNGSDIFIGGQNQGADAFRNVSANDIVHLNDASLSDIVATAEDNGTIGIAFNTGNVVTVQSTDNLSARFLLADGSTHQFNHANKSWQRA